MTIYAIVEQLIIRDLHLQVIARVLPAQGLHGVI
jgi:hypothetical protein